MTSRNTKRRAALGFTLLEVLIAMGVLSFLGTAVIVVLRGGIKTWRRGEARRESFELAQAVLGQIADDLGNATVDPETTGRDGKRVEVIFLGEDGQTTDNGCCRVALVRTIRGESENTITGVAGSEINGDKRIILDKDMKHALEGRLKATGGIMEVAWCMGVPGTTNGETLFRGIRTPVGGFASFFASPKNFWRAPLPGAPPAAKLPPEGIAYCRAFASRIIYFELLYATPWTNTWSKDVPPRRTTAKGSESGPLTYWDSTRAILKSSTDPRLFTTFLDATSLTNPTDDILPSRVKVTLVFRENDWADSSTYLAKDVTAGAQELYVTEPDRLPKEGGFIYLSERQTKPDGYAYVNGEWIEYDDVTGSKVHVVKRGARGTKAAAHAAFAEASIGRTFEAVISLPAGREDWGNR